MTLLSRYQEAAELTRQMLAAAESRDWDGFIAIAETRERVFAALPQNLPPLPENEKPVLAAAIHEILAAHKAIEDCARPWLQDTAILLKAFRDAETKVGEAANRSAQDAP